MAQSPTSWQEIRSEVLRRIRTRAWPPGALIPGEIALAREFDCSRTTVSKALNALADDGMLDRRRRAGTRVVKTPVRQATLSIPIIRQEVETTGAVYRHTLLERVEAVAKETVSARMGLPPGTPLLRLRTLHLADERPHAYEDRWVNPQAVPDIASADLKAISANEWLVQNTHYSEGTLGLQAEAAGKVEARLLEIAEGTPVFVLDRITRSGDQPITLVRLTYPPRHRLTISL